MKITLAASPMSMFDKLFRGKGKKRPSEKASPKAKQKPSSPKAKSKAAAPATPDSHAPANTSAVEAMAADTRSPEERVGITAGMDKAAIKEQLAKMFRRYNRLASSLDGDARIEAEGMLDLIVQMREKHL